MQRRIKLDHFEENYIELFKRYLSLNEEVFKFFSLHKGFMKNLCKEELEEFEKMKEILQSNLPSIKLSKIKIQSDLKTFSSNLSQITSNMNHFFTSYYQNVREEDAEENEELSCLFEIFQSNFLNRNETNNQERKQFEEENREEQVNEEHDELQEIDTENEKQEENEDQNDNNQIEITEDDSTYDSHVLDDFIHNDHAEEEEEGEQQVIEEDLFSQIQIPVENDHEKIKYLLKRFNYTKSPAPLKSITRTKCKKVALKLGINFHPNVSRNLLLEKLFLYWMKVFKTEDHYNQFVLGEINE